MRLQVVARILNVELVRYKKRGSVSSLLADWIRSYSRSPSFGALQERISARQGITPAPEAAMLYGLIQQIRPQWAVEIGTFFADTTRVMAEAIVDWGICGKVITIDPFGAERAPALIKSWSRDLQEVTEFKPINSMQFFLDLETSATAKGDDSPLGLMFIDGHHSFEYVLYDIMRSADHINPSGAIVIDNLEQEGPKSALTQFLDWNPAWKTVQFPEHPTWGVLLPPQGMQVASRPVKITKRRIAHDSVDKLRFNLDYISHTGTLFANLCLFAVPFDYHCHGKGIVELRAGGRTEVMEKSETVEIILPQGLRLDVNPEEMHVCYELELAYLADEQANGHVLLDKRKPLTFVTASGAYDA
jgi:predicted O-methyltransferase YrrM